jgi:hypothetical protein
MKFCILTLLSLILMLNAQYTTSKYDTLFIKASASFHNHQYFVEPAKKQIIDIGEDIVPFLVSNCGSQQPREYHALRDLFSKIDHKLSSRYLMDEIRKMDKESFSTAVEFLGLSKYNRGLEFLEPFMEIDSAWVKVSTLRGISDLNDPLSARIAKKYAKDPDYKIRWQAAAVFGKMNTVEGDRELVTMLNDSLQLVSHTALQYLNSHLKADTLKQRIKLIDRKLESPLLDLLKKKYIENKDAALISEMKVETVAPDSMKLLTIENLVSENSVIYNALEQMYMGKQSYFLPVKTDKELFLFPSIAKMFADPMIQVSLPHEVKNGYEKFPSIDFSNVLSEFRAEMLAQSSGKVDINEFVKRQKNIAGNFDKVWSGYTEKDSILTKVFERSISEEEETDEEEISSGKDEISVMIEEQA